MPGKVYDANAPMLEGLIEIAGAVPVDLGVLPDRADRVREVLAEAARRYDVLVVSGGASQGAEDHVARTIDAIGKRHLWQIAIKPGRPMSFGQIGDCVVLAIPRKSGRCICLFPNLCEAGAGMPRRWHLGRARALSDRRRVRADEETGAPRVLARQANAQGWAACR